MFSLAFLFCFTEDSILMLFSLLLLLCVMLSSSGIKGETEFDKRSKISSTAIRVLQKNIKKQPPDSKCRMCCKAEKHIKHIAAGSTNLRPLTTLRHKKVAGHSHWTIREQKRLVISNEYSFQGYWMAHFEKRAKWGEGVWSGGGCGRCFGSVECRVRQTDASLNAFDTGDYFCYKACSITHVILHAVILTLYLVISFGIWIRLSKLFISLL